MRSYLLNELFFNQNSETMTKNEESVEERLIHENKINEQDLMQNHFLQLQHQMDQLQHEHHRQLEDLLARQDKLAYQLYGQQRKASTLSRNPTWREDDVMNYTLNSKMTRKSSTKCLQFATPISGELEQKYKRLAVEIHKINLQANI